jgi:hypothetical protein
MQACVALISASNATMSARIALMSASIGAPEYYNANVLIYNTEL